MVSNTKRIDTIERHLGKLDALEKKVKDLIGAREGFDLPGPVDKFKELESAIQPLVKEVSALSTQEGALLACLVETSALMHLKP